MDESRLSRRRVLAGAGSALMAGIAGCSLGAPQPDQGNVSNESSDFPTRFDDPGANPDEPVADSPLAEVYQDVVDSVTGIRVEGDSSTTAGSGWVYDHDGDADFLVTNEHVVRDAEQPFVWFTNAGWRETRVRGTDGHSDLAVLEILKDGAPEEATGLPLVDNPAAVGTEVAAVGNPFGLTGSFTTGVVSGRNRNIDIPGRQYSIADGVQTDAAVNQGNSGGPLVTYDREVAGVINAGQGDNVGFAISARMVERVVPALIEEGEFDHSRMGVLLTDVTPELIEANSLPVTWGVYIDAIQDDAPADGVLQGSSGETTVRGRRVPTGGDVIVGLAHDGVDWPVPTTERLSAFLALYTDPGDTIEVDTIRDGERMTVELTLGERDDFSA